VREADETVVALGRERQHLFVCEPVDELAERVIEHVVELVGWFRHRKYLL